MNNLVDLLEEDKPISNQKFACLSFISPENVLKQKNIYYMEKFLKGFDLKDKMDTFREFLNFMSFKHNLNFEEINKDLEDFCNDQKEHITYDKVSDEFKTFLNNNEDKLEVEFSEQNNFETNTRGLKVRGVFPTQGEAELRCKMLRESDPNHDVYVGPVGMWIPWEPDAYKTGKVEFLENELNQLMNEKMKNEKEAKDAFEQRVKDAKRKTIEENIKNAEKSGNVLSQTITNDGELVNVANTNTQESDLLKDNNEITTEKIKDVLFEGDNIVMDNDTDHGLSDLTMNKNNKTN